MNTRVKLTEQEKKEKKRAYDKKYKEANKARIKKQRQEHYLKNRERLLATTTKYGQKYRESLKLNKPIVYCLPNYNKFGYDKYCGVTNQPSTRMKTHKRDGNNTQGWIILGEYETREEALIVEAKYHEQGYAGKRGFDKKVA